MPEIPELDLVFSVNAASANSDKTLRTMKDTINYIIDKYGVHKIKYSLLVYGTDSTPLLRFKDKNPSVEDIKRLVENIPKTQGKPVLDNALDAARKVFEESVARPGVQRVRCPYVDQL